MKLNHIVKISGLVLGVASLTLLLTGIILIMTAKRCDPALHTAAECGNLQNKRKNGTILVVVGGIGVVIAGVAIMWKQLFRESALVSAVAAVSAAVAAFAAASAASAAAEAGADYRIRQQGGTYVQQIPSSPTLLANVENAYDAIRDLRSVSPLRHD